ncbi:hypothetical protein HG1285_11707, partial [Hydrogenivirga sp. 128-5-R1-1]
TGSLCQKTFLKRKMKYRKKGIKKEHHIIEDGEGVLKLLIKNNL